jgi:hypothetical protein
MHPRTILIIVSTASALALAASASLAADVALDALPSIGVGRLESGVGLGDIDVASAHTYDYTFTGAPTDWAPRGGFWEMTLRWDCDKRWSFYGGYGEGPVALWNKRRFAGDISVEAYVAFKRGLGNFFEYKNPNDLNLTLCGDGANLDTGYAFLLGADLNRRTAILRNGVELAATSDRSALLPVFEDSEFSMESFHRRWWRLKAERSGHTIGLWLDDRPILTAHDPDPLPAGHVAVWTVNNGIVVSRIRIHYAQELPATPPTGGPGRLADARP